MCIVTGKAKCVRVHVSEKKSVVIFDEADTKAQTTRIYEFIGEKRDERELNQSEGGIST